MDKKLMCQNQILIFISNVRPKKSIAQYEKSYWIYTLFPNSFNLNTQGHFIGVEWFWMYNLLHPVENIHSKFLHPVAAHVYNPTDTNGAQNGEQNGNGVHPTTGYAI